jgi:type I restriction enzyme M protein
LEEVRAHHHVVTPGRYVGTVQKDEDEEPFATRFAALTERLEEQFAEAETLTKRIRTALAMVKGPI